jgi:hypothetical protein
MAAPKYEDSKKELIETMRRTVPGGREYSVAEAFLKLKNSETQTFATWVLTLATVGLVLATLILAFRA